MGGLVNQLDRLAAAAPDLAAFRQPPGDRANFAAALARVTPEAAAEARLTYRLVTVSLQLDDPDSLADIAQELIGDGMSAARAGEAALIAPLLKGHSTRAYNGIAANFAAI